jgi:hypothetical protein
MCKMFEGSPKMFASPCDGSGLESTTLLRKKMHGLTNEKSRQGKDREHSRIVYKRIDS